MKVVLRGVAILVVAYRRLLAQWGLALAITLGLIVTVALAVSLPVYADAVNFRVLTTELGTVPGTEGQVARRSPFAYMFRYLGDLHPRLKWSAIEPLDDYLYNRAGAELGLPCKLIVRYVATDNLKLFAQPGSPYAENGQGFGWISLGSITDLEHHITLVEGRFPEVAQVAPDSPVDVLVSEAVATKLGLQVGEIYIAFDANDTLQRGRQTLLQIPLRIAGIWRATDPQEEYWFYDPSALTDVFLLPAESLRGRIGGYADNEVYTALWYLVMDGSQVRATSATGLLSRSAAVQQRTVGLLPGIHLDVSPLEALTTYQLKTSWLAILLYAFSIPILGLILAFIGMAAGLSVERRLNEIAVFRSRGATVVQILGISLAESLLLGAIALGVGVLSGQGLAGLIGRARSFLDFSEPSDLRVVLTTKDWQFGLALLGLTIVAQVVPAIRAARYTVVTYKQERGRILKPRWWQRAYLDVLLLIPAAYGAYILRSKGSLVSPVVDPTLAQANEIITNALPDDPFRNPLLFLVPALAAFALTLVVLRLLPLGMRGIAWLAGRTESVGVLLTARHLARTNGDYAAPLILLILTLSLSTYTASLAQTLDNHAVDQMQYQVGADMRLIEGGQSTVASGLLLSGLPGMGDSESSATAQPDKTVWSFLPVDEHMKAPGVTDATRVGRYAASARLGSGPQSGVFLGVDRADFARVAYWRRDFARTSLGALMNLLALTDNGVLLPREAMAQNALSPGDHISVDVEAPGGKVEMDMQVVGSFDLFTSWYPQDGILLVGNLDNLFEQAGGQVPYDVWLKTDGATQGDQIVADLRQLGFRISYADDARLQLQQELHRPERQGLFGLLSVGFAGAAFFTVFGFLLYALFSFRRRFIELGVLRAIGLSVGQMTILLASELAFLILTGLLAGTLLGAGISNLFIPYLQVGNTPAAHIPPYLVTIGWPTIIRIYALLGLMFLVALALLTTMLLMMRIFEAIKLGETL